GLDLGVTVSGVSQAEMIDKAVSLGIFSAVQATWNLHERAAEDALARCGLKVIVKEALANGRLADRDAEALAAALAKPWATVVLSGAASVDVLRSNLRALETPPPGDLPELIEDSETYWAKRSQLKWN
ncbi:MAG TPA: aldo/keto reductase, partial [Solirubrobacter sp.]|nr:aldo/keto reductase [Solirubrobacter sp.]